MCRTLLRGAHLRTEASGSSQRIHWEQPSATGTFHGPLVWNKTIKLIYHPANNSLYITVHTAAKHKPCLCWQHRLSISVTWHSIHGLLWRSINILPDTKHKLQQSRTLPSHSERVNSLSCVSSVGNEGVDEQLVAISSCYVQGCVSILIFTVYLSTYQDKQEVHHWFTQKHFFKSIHVAIVRGFVLTYI